MLKIPVVTALWMLAVMLLTPVQAFAQIPPVVPSPLWGEPINTPDRFVVLTSYNNEAVYDNETGLVWEQSPSTTNTLFVDAQFACNNKTVGNRKGWRLPTIQELASLIDPTVPLPPTLPAGHPFGNVMSSVFLFRYWSATIRATDTPWVVTFYDGNVHAFPGGTHFAWCVRGGRGVDAQ